MALFTQGATHFKCVAPTANSPSPYMSEQKTKQSSSGNEVVKITLEDKLQMMMYDAGFPIPAPQQPVTKLGKRKWSVDFYFKFPHDLVVEVQGGTWMAGRHNRGPGYRSDSEKLNYLSCRHTRTVYVTSDMIRDGSALDWIYLALAHSWNAVEQIKPDTKFRKKLDAFLKRREEFYGQPLSLEAVCSFNRIKRKNTRKRKARTKQGAKRVDRKRSAPAAKSLRGKKASVDGKRKTSNHNVTRRSGKSNDLRRGSGTRNRKGVRTTC